MQRSIVRKMPTFTESSAGNKVSRIIHRFFQATHLQKLTNETDTIIDKRLQISETFLRNIESYLLVRHVRGGLFVQVRSARKAQSLH
jgi:hypothetical protein